MRTVVPQYGEDTIHEFNHTFAKGIVKEDVLIHSNPGFGIVNILLRKESSQEFIMLCNDVF